MTGDVGVGVDGGDDDAAETGGDESLGTGRRAAGVVAGLQGDVSCASAQVRACLLYTSSTPR